MAKKGNPDQTKPNMLLEESARRSPAEDGNAAREQQLTRIAKRALDML